MARSNKVTTPRPGRFLSRWTEYNASASVASYAEGDDVRVDNQLVSDYGRSDDITLSPGSYVFSAYLQSLADCTNACVVVRRKSDFMKLAEFHITVPDSNNERHHAPFSLAEETTVTILFGVGSYGAQSNGSARFGRFMLEPTLALGGYFDGATPDAAGTDYAWAGTAHDSASTAIATTTEPEAPPNSGGTNADLEAKCRAVWEGIKARYIRVDGGVRQREADDKITSEGQAYAATIAVQLDDRATFDLVESFSTNRLERRNYLPGFTQSWRANTANDPRIYAPNLMAWDFRPNPFASNPANTVNDWNFATDADVDRARALFWARARWGDEAYLDKALAIVRELKLYGFCIEGVTADTQNGNAGAGGTAYQVTDEFQNAVELDANGNFVFVGPGHHLDGTSQPVFEVNVSYVDPGLHHLAKDIGSDSWWDQAITGAWDMLTKVSDNADGIPTTDGLFPDWNDYSFGTDDANAVASGSRGWFYSRSTDYKYDAFRTPYRMIWSYTWYGDTQVPTILAPLKAHYGAEWTTYGTIAAEYDHVGNRLSGGYEKPMMTAGAVMVLECNDPTNATAAAIRTAKLDPDDRYNSLDSDGYRFWNDYVGAPFNYFTDFWLEMFYLRDAGLWTNWGQTDSSTGGVKLEVADVGTSSDTVDLRIDVGLSVLDVGTSNDVVSLTAVLGFAVLDVGTSQDIVDLSVTDVPDIEPPAPPVVVLPRDRYLWLSPTNETTELTDFVNGAEVLRGISGRGAPPARIRRIVVPGHPGERTIDVTHGPRELALPLRAMAPDADVLWETLRRLVRTMDPVQGEGILRHISRSGRVSDLYCRAVTGLGIENEETYGPAVHIVPLVFQADDPYWYGETVTAGFAGDEAKGWFPILPMGLASSSILGEVEITTFGDVATWPIWTIVGPGSNPALENITTGETLALDAPELGDGEIVTVDMRPGRKSVTGPDGSNWFRYLVQRSMWPLRPGANQVRLTLVGAIETSFVSVAYQDRKLIP